MKIVVLDDDPTGTQTVHGVPVLTRWDEADLARELAGPAPAVYLLTNSRALPEEEAVALARRLAAQIQATGADVRVISRGDSTLRGHYPAETDALAALGPFDATILCPYFGEGERTTVDGVHLLRGQPVGETEFARDRTFGYRHSRLADWVAEKHGDRPAPPVYHWPEDDLLMVPQGAVVVMNVDGEDVLRSAVADVSRAEDMGYRYLFRTAASWVRAYAGIEPRPLLPPSVVFPNSHGGLVVVGSYVEATTRQLTRLKEGPYAFCELDVDRLDEVTGHAASLDAAIRQGQTAVLATSRSRRRAGELDHGGAVSRALVDAVRGIPSRPAFVVAKGGITSSDVATDGLDVRRAEVLGQALPGVPVWRLGEESRLPGLVYAVFPGNVGDDGSLAELVRLWDWARSAPERRPRRLAAVNTGSPLPES